ncbi:uracil-DNA glycosylase [Candidatus Poribacteria bacterium]|nr:MAG: uracil-DNA glycosylase [Candidatus Poribacteria bacterium]
MDNPIEEYLQLVTLVREHVVEQLEFGLSEIEIKESEPQTKLADVDLATLDADAKSCTKCGLHEGRTNVVFGVGNPNAELMFVGEAPGADEDLQGEPFVGRAGKLLTKIIEDGMKLKRDDVYIANVLKCRPPGNRNPVPDEVETCSPYLIRQIELIKPKVMVALGSFAAKTLLNTTTNISALRGQLHPFTLSDNFEKPPRVMPTYHPAYLLRNPNAKRDVWEDIKIVLEYLSTD